MSDLVPHPNDDGNMLGSGLEEALWFVLALLFWDFHFLISIWFPNTLFSALSHYQKWLLSSSTYYIMVAESPPFHFFCFYSNKSLPISTAHWAQADFNTQLSEVERLSKTLSKYNVWKKIYYLILFVEFTDSCQLTLLFKKKKLNWHTYIPPIWDETQSNFSGSFPGWHFDRFSQKAARSSVRKTDTMVFFDISQGD